jgi:hypothetical protein
MRKALTAMAWAFAWGVTREAIGHDPSADDVADWWFQSRRTAFRNQSAFKAAFPMLESPAPIVDQPETLESCRKMARAMRQLIDSKKSRPPAPDLTIMQMAMRRATI